jgi:hypothetical protein
MSYPKTYVTQRSEAGKIKNALVALPPFLTSELDSGTILTVVYGYGTRLHPDLCYRDMEVGVGWLNKFINDSLRQELVLPADSDLTITVPDDRLIIHFCHEGDIHTGGTDLALQKRLWATKPFSEFSFSFFEGKSLN